MRRVDGQRPFGGLGTAGIAAALVAAVALVCVGSASAQEPPPVSGEVLVILASPPAGTIDPRLASIPALRQPPFSAYGTMSVLSVTPIELRVRAPRVIDLPNGRQLRIEIEGVTDDGRYRVRVSINRPGEADYLPLLSVVASPGDPFFVAGQTYRSGTLIIATTLGTPSEG